jgi:hypothetical protein
MGETVKPNNGHILNVLHLPLGHEYRQCPIYQCVSSSFLFEVSQAFLRPFNSHAFAWQQTRGMRGIPSSSAPTDHTSWATAAGKNAVSWIHIDAYGLATAIDAVTGTKYWVVCKPRRGQDAHGPGDMSSMYWAADLQIDESASQCFEHEAVLIQPSTVLLVPSFLS